jgi:hypothetical protein
MKKPPPPDNDHWLSVPSYLAWMTWRQERVTIEQVETKPLFGRRSPIGESFGPWCDLKQQSVAGDELWTFDSPKRFWRQHMGSRGLVLVRDGNFVAGCVIAMN